MSDHADSRRRRSRSVCAGGSRRTSTARPARRCRAELISGGRSNLTYLVGDGTHEWVLRRPPLGHVLPTAHDMAREYTVIRALADTAVPVPAGVRVLRRRRRVNGAPFYVMANVDGVILRTPDDMAELTTDAGARVLRSARSTCSPRSTRVDYTTVGLDEFGHPDGFLERQVRRWGEQWERSKASELPAIDELARRLRAALPESPPPTIVHGDYRLDNTMLATDDPGRDRRGARLGDVDARRSARRSRALPALLGPGRRAGDRDRRGRSTRRRASSPARRSSTATRRRRGTPLDSLDWYEAFAAYKLAIIVAGIHARYLMGKTLGDGFDSMGEMIARLAESALERTSHSSIAALRG